LTPSAVDQHSHFANSYRGFLQVESKKRQALLQQRNDQILLVQQVPGNRHGRNFHNADGILGRAARAVAVGIDGTKSAPGRGELVRIRSIS
jgi:hypothetical protein